MKSRSRFRTTLVMLLVIVSFTCAGLAATNVNVMTYNVDAGTDFGAIVGVLGNPKATPADFVAAVTQTINEVVNTNPTLRAQLIAKEIANAQPDLVGLQEAAVWTFNNQQLDLLQLILGQLAALGQHYTAIVTVPEFQIDIAQLGVSFTDRDVILARTDEPTLQITASQQGHYSAVIPLPAFPPYLSATNITRGWAYVDVRLDGTPFRFITTHLEDGTNPISLFALVQALQAIQLVYSPARTGLPVIIGGDFNTIANDPSSPTFLAYSFMLANVFIDSWSTANPNLVGATCCQEDLLNPESQLTQRLDLVFMRSPGLPRVRVVGAQLVGDAMIDSLSWPSDHAGVSAIEAIGRNH